MEGLGFMMVFLGIFIGGACVGANAGASSNRDEGYRCAMNIEEVRLRKPENLTEADQTCLKIYKRVNKSWSEDVCK